MGTEASKVHEENNDEVIPEGSVPSTPILTPKVNLPRDLDPRSPSNNVVRTPIETLMLKHKSSLDGVLNVVQCTPMLKHLSIDPRSPTVDFNRTPIIIVQDKEKSQETCDKKAFDINKRKSGFLETNLDYVETDIDVVYMEKSPLKLKDIKENSLCDQEEKVINLGKEIGEIKLGGKRIEEVQIVHIDLKGDDNNIKDSEIELNSKNTLNVSDSQTDNSLKVTENLPEDLTVVINTVKDFDKKLMNLIYEDEDTKEENKKEGDGLRLRNRTPLATRNFNVEAKKIPKLKVADKPKKLNRRLSKIPISKVSTKKNINIQCENTPPHALLECERKGKLRKSEWDGDKTLVI